MDDTLIFGYDGTILVQLGIVGAHDSALRLACIQAGLHFG
jgi:hypothetical protein